MSPPGSSGSRSSLVLALLLGMTVVIAVISLGFGAFPLGLRSVARIVGARLSAAELPSELQREAAILRAIRVPRVLVGVLIGATLGAAGAGLQGLFRTPLVEPGLVGVSSGATTVAVALAPLSVSLATSVGEVGMHIVRLAATAGGAVVVAVLLLAVSTRRGEPSVLTMLLVGIAINAFAAALISVIVFANPNASQVEATYWLLGSLTNASWIDVAILGPVSVVGVATLWNRGSQLDAAVLGPTAARSMGVNVVRLRRTVLAAVAVTTGAAAAVGGVIAFIGLVAPLMMRRVVGARHRTLILGSGLIGAALMTTMDAVARTIFAPTEMPVGVFVAVVGAPLFLWALLDEQRHGRL